MNSLVNAVLGAALVGGWTFMWLAWSFQGDVRSWITALLFPRKWLRTTTRREVLRLSPSSFLQWLVNSSDAPMAVCQLLSCHACWSAHVAGVGTILLALSGHLELGLAPLVWASGATIGFLLYVNRSTHH